jgi:hypothetical protein
MGPTDAIDYEPQRPADAVGAARAKFAEELEKAANELYKKTGFVVTACTLQYHVQRKIGNVGVANVRVHALDVEVLMPEDVL